MAIKETPAAIDRKWKPEFDSRADLRKLMGDTTYSREDIDRFISALTCLVGTRDHVCFVGFGTWDKRSLTRKTPDGKTHSVLRVYFSLADAAKRKLYGGRHLERKEKSHE